MGLKYEPSSEPLHISAKSHTLTWQIVEPAASTDEKEKTKDEDLYFLS